MNNEIKEILGILRRCTYGNEVYLIKEHGATILLDYITNLQEQLHQASLDIQELTERDIECPSWCDKLTNLQQENERLKELDENYPIEEELAEAYKREEDYKSRIEKAVEYIEEKNYGDEYSNFWVACGEDCACPYEAIERLLNILNGRSDE